MLVWGLCTPTFAPLAFLVFPLARMVPAREVMAGGAARPKFHDLAGFPGNKQEACRALVASLALPRLKLPKAVLTPLRRSPPHR